MFTRPGPLLLGTPSPPPNREGMLRLSASTKLTLHQ